MYEKYAKGKQDYHEYLLIRATSLLVVLDPETLRTCKQLYAEGSKILYSNTVNCRVGRPFFGANFYVESDGPVVLSSRFSGMNLNLAWNLPSAVLHKMSRCRIQVFVHHKKQWQDVSLRRLKRCMETLAEAIGESSWQHIQIQMIHMYGATMEYSVRKPHQSRRFLSA